MAKVIDITEKLGFEPSPVMKIRDIELSVRNDAETMLRLVDIMNKKGELEAISEITPLLFSESDQKKLNKLKLNFMDFSIIIRSAIQLVTGEDNSGENETRITT
jgi:hypothetical protein